MNCCFFFFFFPFIFIITIFFFILAARLHPARRSRPFLLRGPCLVWVISFFAQMIDREKRAGSVGMGGVGGSSPSRPASRT